VFENLSAALEAAGATTKHVPVVNLTVYLTDMADRQAFPAGPRPVHLDRPPHAPWYR
jgi:enamine deaminase RidA (YjgF/YER057c/UK114 family)